MKDYLKIGDVFDLPVKPSHVHDENGYGFKLMLLHSIQSEYAAHAINSHDELVEMNKELMEALELAREYLNHPGGASGSAWFKLNDMVISVITKAKGGAE